MPIYFSSRNISKSSHNLLKSTEKNPILFTLHIMYQELLYKHLYRNKTDDNNNNNNASINISRYLYTMSCFKN